MASKSVPQIRNFAVYHVESDLSDITAMNNQEKACGHIILGEFNLLEETWTELTLDLTPYVNSIGYYDVSFHILAYDYTNKQPTGLQFKDWKLEMYGKEFLEGIAKLDGKSVFRITALNKLWMNFLPVCE